MTGKLLDRDDRKLIEDAIGELDFRFWRGARPLPVVHRTYAAR